MGRPRKREKSVKLLVRLDGPIKERLEKTAARVVPPMSVNDVVSQLIYGLVIRAPTDRPLTSEDVSYRPIGHADVEQWLATEIQRYVQVLAAAMGSILKGRPDQIAKLIDNVQRAAAEGRGPELWRDNIGEAMGYTNDGLRDVIENPLAGRVHRLDHESPLDMAERLEKINAKKKGKKKP